MQADQGIHFPLTESMDTVEYVNEYRMPRSDCMDVHAQLDLRIWHKGPFPTLHVLWTNKKNIHLGTLLIGIYVVEGVHSKGPNQAQTCRMILGPFLFTSTLRPFFCDVAHKNMRSNSIILSIIKSHTQL